MGGRGAFRTHAVAVGRVWLSRTGDAALGREAEPRYAPRVSVVAGMAPMRPAR